MSLTSFKFGLPLDTSTLHVMSGNFLINTLYITKYILAYDKKETFLAIDIIN